MKSETKKDISQIKETSLIYICITKTNYKSFHLD